MVGGFTSLSTLTINNGTANTFVGTIGGAGSNNNNLAVTKTGAGSLTLVSGGASTYTGATTVQAGTFALAGGASLAGTAITVGTGTAAATFQVAGNSTIGTAGSPTLTVNGGTAPSTLSTIDGTVNTLNINSATSGATVLTLGGASGVITLNMDVGSSADEIALGSGLKASVGAGGVTVNITGLGSLSGTTQTLISAPGGGLTGTFTLGTITGNTAGYNLALVDSSTALQLTETATPLYAFWNGSTSSLWTNPNNFVTTYGGATAPATYPGGGNSNVFFTTSGTVSNLSNSLGQSISLNSLSFTSSSGAVTINNTGGFTLGLNATSSFMDQNSVNYGPGIGLVVQSGASADTIQTNVLLGASQAWEIDSSAANALTVSGNISDGGNAYNLTKTGTGKHGPHRREYLYGRHDLRGRGTERRQRRRAEQHRQPHFTSGTLQYSAANTVDYSSRIVNSSGAISIDTNSQNVTYASALAASNSGGLTKLGAGTLTLKAANLDTGTTTFGGGTLNLGNAGALPSTGNLTFTGGTLQYSTVNTTDYSSRIVNSSSAISIDTNGQNLTYASALDVSNSGGFTKLGAGTLTLAAANLDTGTTTFGAGTVNLGSAGAIAAAGNVTFTGGTLQYSAVNTTDYSSRIVNSSGAISLDTNGQNITFAGALAASNSGGLTKLNTGTLTLNGSDLYTGTTTLAAGTLALGNAGALNSTGNITFTGGTLQYLRGQHGRLFHAPGGKHDGAHGHRCTNGQTVVFAGVVPASDTAGFDQDRGFGTLFLFNNNAFSGQTTINAGTLEVNANGNAAGTGATVNINNGATLQFVAGSFLLRQRHSFFGVPAALAPWLEEGTILLREYGAAAQD